VAATPGGQAAEAGWGQHTAFLRCLTGVKEHWEGLDRRGAAPGERLVDGASVGTQPRARDTLEPERLERLVGLALVALSPAWPEGRMAVTAAGLEAAGAGWVSRFPLEVGQIAQSPWGRLA